MCESQHETRGADALKGGPLTRESYLADVAAYKGRQMRQRLVAPPQPPSDMVPQSMAPIDPLPIRPMSPERFAELKRAFEDAWEVAPVRRPLMVLSPPLTNLEAIGNGANEGELLAAWFANSEADVEKQRASQDAEFREAWQMALDVQNLNHERHVGYLVRLVDGFEVDVPSIYLRELQDRLGVGLVVGPGHPSKALHTCRFDRALADVRTEAQACKEG